ncbi:MAG: fumarylacetoacetate hydrolase family protein [Bryobacteraceae bacterium]|nr:fumarylacetoacetate hydrolase family protein [Bryobacteraceae bacterium]
MRLCTFEVRTHLGRHQRLGAIVPAGIVDLNFAYALHRAQNGEPRPQAMADALLPSNMLAFLQGGPFAMDRARHVLERLGNQLTRDARGINDETLLYDFSEVRLKAPIPNPPSLRDFYAFEDHVRRGFEKRGEPMPQEWYEMPVYYKGGHHNILGTDEDVLWPSFTEKFDYELEMAAVIGRRGTNLKASEARNFIAGYMVMNDFSARDIQRKEMKVRLGPAKGKDWATALGPVLVTADEVPDPYNLQMTARVNGELWSEGSSASLYWTFEQMLEFLTRDDTVLPGDVIGSGTVGTGCGLELDRWVKPGDVMELEIEGLGVLRNRVVRPASVG